MVNSYGMNVNHLVGGWYTYPPEKYEFVNWDECSQYMETNVSKHQPVLLLRSSFELLHARCQKSHECCFKSICHCPVTRKFMKILGKTHENPRKNPWKSSLFQRPLDPTGANDPTAELRDEISWKPGGLAWQASFGTRPALWNCVLWDSSWGQEKWRICPLVIQHM